MWCRYSKWKCPTCTLGSHLNQRQWYLFTHHCPELAFIRYLNSLPHRHAHPYHHCGACTERSGCKPQDMWPHSQTVSGRDDGFLCRFFAVQVVVILGCDEQSLPLGQMWQPFAKALLCKVFRTWIHTTWLNMISPVSCDTEANCFCVSHLCSTFHPPGTTFK